MKASLLSVLAFTAVVTTAPGIHAANPATTVAIGLKNPESVCIDPKGLLYVSEIGEFGKDGDGRIAVIEDGKAHTFFGGLDDPKGLVFLKDAFYVADKTRVVKIGADGELRVFQQFLPDNFPKPPMFLNDVAVEVHNEVLLVSDSGDIQGNDGADYRIDTRSGAIETIADTSTLPAIHTPNGVAFDGASFRLVVDHGTGDLHRIRFADRSAEKIGTGFAGGDDLGGLGKSITGGAVYRGKGVPALQGMYLYADYVSSEFRALAYDAEKRRVVANRPLPRPNFGVLSFGEDEQGELYVLGNGPDGPAVMRLEPAAKTAGIPQRD